SRKEAEEFLKEKPVGTYLLREGDSVTQSMVKCLSETNHMSIRPLILTTVEKEEKISDLLLLQTELGWTLYLDDPLLKSPLYHYHFSLQDLLDSLKEIACYPLLQ